jgi:fructose-bisphosphate aldolase, class II
MPLVTSKKIVDQAKLDGVGVVGFDVLDLISVEAALGAAHKANAPMLLMVPEASFGHIDVGSFSTYLVDRASRADVDVAVHLDHGESLETVKRVIDLGYTSVMFDGSALPLEQNIEETAKIAEYARAAGVSVEAEIGHVAGGEGDMDGAEIETDLFTDPTEAEVFARETGVDMLAVAFGTVHGVYKGEPNLDLERLQAIRDRLDIPLVMHGGSGLSDQQYRDVIKHGIHKINLFTNISIAAVSKAVDHALAKERKLHFAELLAVGQMTTQAMLAHYYQVFTESNDQS